jgi:hypothetical protein
LLKSHFNAPRSKWWKRNWNLQIVALLFEGGAICLWAWRIWISQWRELVVVAFLRLYDTDILAKKVGDLVCILSHHQIDARFLKIDSSKRRKIRAFTFQWKWIQR